VSWFKQRAGLDASIQAQERGISVEQLLNEQAEIVPPGSDGLMTVLDWLSPPSNPYRKGIMIGFDHRHTKSHMYRSILEAIAYTIKSNMDLMVDETKSELKDIVIIGAAHKVIF
jgi:sugar (pentulose or hexulose) kinase